MSGSRAEGDEKLHSGVEMAHVDAPSVARAAAAKPTTAHSSLPASPYFPRREPFPAHRLMSGNDSEQENLLRIRVWYLDDVFTRAEPKYVPDVATLKQLLPEGDASYAFSPLPKMAGDHFTEVPHGLSKAATSREGEPQLPVTDSNQRLDTMNSLSGRQPFPLISLRAASLAHPGGHPAWVSVRAPSQSELTEILDWLPIHVLTRRRILNVLIKHCADEDDESDADEPTGDEHVSKSAKKSKNYKVNRRGDNEANEMAASHANAANGERAGDDLDNKEDEEGEAEDLMHHHHTTPHDNFLEYFPAHGYAVLCLQAVEATKGENAHHDEMSQELLPISHTKIPSTPVVAVAFESTLFTFSPDRFGGEDDVRLIIANHVASSSAHGARGGMPARVTTITTLSSTMTLTDMDRGQREAAERSGADRMMEPNTTAINANAGAPGNESVDLHEGNANTTTPFHPAAAARTDGHAPSPSPLSYPALALAAPALGNASSPMHFAESPSTTSSSNWSAATAISVVCSSLVAAIIAHLQQSTRVLMREADQLDELVLQIIPSQGDQDDLLVRMKSIRNLIAVFHIDALQKERVLKQLLLPAMRQTPLAQSIQAIERYQRSLSSVRSTVIKLRKGRDIVNLASMTLISGVSARLLTHCNFMDYLNHVQTQIAVVVMPITVIPGIFAGNFKVPWADSDSMIPFYCLLFGTLGLMAIGVAYPLYRFFVYRMPKALAPLE